IQNYDLLSVILQISIVTKLSDLPFFNINPQRKVCQTKITGTGNVSANVKIHDQHCFLLVKLQFNLQISVLHQRVFKLSEKRIIHFKFEVMFAGL
ncbi:MAG: hypothetical protein JWM28_2870, partial [Chitinophagaceae bacterium]|nr:hypothetical protein [Chitinophagaceae bacterium]